MIQLRTKRLIVRNFTPEDWQSLREIIIEYMASPGAAYDYAWPTSEEEVRGACAWFATEDRFAAVCDIASGRLIGYLSLGPHDTPGVFNLGYCFREAVRGQGLAWEACRAGLRHLFEGKSARLIIAGTADANTPSRRLLARLGFTQGKADQVSFHHDTDGRPIYFSAHEYALSREAWLAQAE